jgi:PleD family two-component response regulator
MTPPSTLLFVDDAPANLSVLRDLFEPLGYRTLAATSGMAALQISQKIVPDLVLLDVMMPGLDGFETCRLMRQSPALAQVPIIFLTASNEPDAVMEGFHVGGVDYVTKPFRHEEVVARARTHLEVAQLNKTLIEKNHQLEQLTTQLKARQIELEEALARVKSLRGLLPICAHCKKIRDDKGYWQGVENYVRAHSEAEFTHGICPTCLKDHFPEYEKARAARTKTNAG